MSVIVVKGIPRKWNENYIRLILFKAIQGPFQITNVQINPANKFKSKVAHLRLSGRLNPEKVIENITIMSASKPIKLIAFIPRKAPDLPRCVFKNNKFASGTGNILDTPKKARLIAHREILTELQIKYPALHNLSRKTYHKLLDDIARTIMERLTKVASVHANAQCPSSLGAAYRKSHPHFGDFQLIVSALHRLQDAAGAPRCPLQEKQLLPAAAVVDNMPDSNVKGACAKYTERILKKLEEHVNSLNTEVSEGDTEEDSARKRVREELKKIIPFLPLMVKQVINKHFQPAKLSFHKIRIYGEPHLPGRAALAPVLARLGAPPAARSPRAYNMLALRVPPPRLHALLALDGTTISGAKLVIRSADGPIYHSRKYSKHEVADEELGVPEEWSDAV